MMFKDVPCASEKHPVKYISQETTKWLSYNAHVSVCLVVERLRLASVCCVRMCMCVSVCVCAYVHVYVHVHMYVRVLVSVLVSVSLRVHAWWCV